MNDNEITNLLQDTASGKIPFEQAILVALKLNFERGYQQGFQNGVPTGYALCLQKMSPAISDGLRHGSPECGRAMRDLKTR